MKTLMHYDPFNNWGNPILDWDLMEPFRFSFTPSINGSVKEKPFEYSLEYHLPGIEKRNLKTRIENNQLIIEGKERRSSKKIFRKEKSVSESSFYRTFHLCEDMDTDKIKAKFSKGVLKITIPKKKEFINYREIPVSGGDTIVNAKEVDVENGILSRFRNKIHSMLKKAA
ncbi:MAG: Hsp20 family protein [Bacteroidota bacterium]